MNFSEQVKTAIDTIIDLCAYHEGQDCEHCEAYQLCQCNKPMELIERQSS